MDSTAGILAEIGFESETAFAQLSQLREIDIGKVDSENEPGWLGYHQIKAHFGVWSVYRKAHVDLGKFYLWKTDPVAHRGMTEEMATEMGILIQRWQPVLPKDWVMTVPPQGASARKTKDGMYPAGFLAKAVSVILGLDFVDTLGRSDLKTRHHPKAALEQSPFRVSLVPPSVALVIDDMATSGTTMRFALTALASKHIPAFGFVWVG